MLHHISVGVSDLTRSATFYDAVLTQLGYIRAFEDIRPGEQHQAIGYGLELDKDKFTIKERHSGDLAPGKGFHLAFAAPSIDSVNGWHAAGLANGGIDQGSPKFWDDFGPGYYAAYLTDPDGWQIEVVFKETR